MSYAGKTIKSIKAEGTRFEGCVGAIVFTDGTTLELGDNTDIDEELVSDSMPVGNMKVNLNEYDGGNTSFWVGKGDCVYAGFGAEEWGFTIGELYKIQGVCGPSDITMINDAGEEEGYTVEYFRQYKPMGY